MYNPQERFDYFYKLIIIGDERVGKSNLLQRMTHNRFIKKPKKTYGVEYEAVTMPLPGTNQRVKAQIWDTSGAKHFLEITTTHYRYAVGAFLIYDVTDRASFTCLPDWLSRIREFSDDHVQVALVGNKLDKISGEQLLPKNSKTIFDVACMSVFGRKVIEKGEMFKDLINDGEDLRAPRMESI